MRAHGCSIAFRRAFVYKKRGRYMWIAYKDFIQRALCGPVSIKRGEQLEEAWGILFRKGLPVCLSTSQKAKEHFAVDIDGKGLKRGDITSHIAFGPSLTETQKAIIRSDPFFNRFIRDNPETILFTEEFFRAPMVDLYTVCRKLGVAL